MFFGTPCMLSSDKHFLNQPFTENSFEMLRHSFLLCFLDFQKPFLEVTHPGLIRARRIRFLVFEISYVLFYNSTTFKLTELSFFYSFI